MEYTVEDLSCEYCLYKPKKDKPCPRKKCCCEEERNEAIKREQAMASQQASTNG